MLRNHVQTDGYFLQAKVSIGVHQQVYLHPQPEELMLRNHV
jgi:hypothetical protein